MPACVAGHGVYEFPARFGYIELENKYDLSRHVNHASFAKAFGLPLPKGVKITSKYSYKGENPRPRTVARRIRQVVNSIEVKP